MALQNAVQSVNLANAPAAHADDWEYHPGRYRRGRPAARPGSGQATIVRTRFSRPLRDIMWFAAGCAGAALLYAWIGFWGLAVPVVVAAATAFTPTEI
jgi:hypothetical protein